MTPKQYEDQSQKLPMAMETEVETQGDVGVQVGASSLSTDDMELIMIIGLRSAGIKLANSL